MLQAMIVDEWVGRARTIAVAHQVEPLEDIDRRIERFTEDLVGQAAAAHERSLPKIVGARVKAILRAETNPRARLVLEQICERLG